jgi:hypothetical protein
MMRTALCLSLICAAFAARSQAPLLERKISVSLQNERIDTALKRISVAGNFTFSYNPSIMDARKAVTYTFINKSVREILDEIFKGTVHYKARGKYIILTSAQNRSDKKEPAIVTGYIVDEATGQRLKDVSVYDPVTLTSTVTDSYGYFEIKIEKPSPDIILSVNRKDYSDTLVAVHSKGRLLNIPIKFNKEKITVIADSAGQKIKRFWKKQVLSFRNINMLNIGDTIYRTSQVSLVPFVGTNHKMSGNVINQYSFNILGGYALGVEKLEIGGLFNLLGGDLHGAQFAGAFNAVGGDVTGLQFAGIFNANGGATRGAQFAGIMNLNRKPSQTFAVAGVMNVNMDDTKGVRLAGVGNISRGQQGGPQAAGVFNISAGDCESVQVAGLCNLAGRNVKGLQAAGLFNIAGRKIKGTQLGGVFNIAGKEIRGTQISGVLNLASKVKGVQIGLINVADSIKGVPFGLISIVWKGYHKIEISADEIFYTNLAFRTGVRQFYNIFTAGAKPATYKEDETVWTFGYGFGTAPRLSRKLFLNLDLTASQIVKGNSIEAVNLLNKMYVGFDYQVLKKMSLTFGATLNGYVTKNSIESYPALFTDYRPDIFYSRDLGSGHNVKMWMGAKVGLRFL